MSRTGAGLRFLAAVIAFAVVGALLVVLLRDDDREPAERSDVDSTAIASEVAEGTSVTDDVLSLSAPPDSSEILVSIDPSGGQDWRLHAVSIEDGVQPRPIGNTPSFERHVDPVWSPDGKSIAFIGYDWDQGYSTLFVMNADGTNQRRLPVDDTAPFGAPTWSPDGMQIAFTGAIPDDSDVEMTASPETGSTTRSLATSIAVDYDILVINVDGTELSKLTQNAADDSRPAWSPDGTRVAWLSRDANVKFAIPWVMNADGSDPRPLVDAEDGPLAIGDNMLDIWDVRWSPDSAWIAFSSNWTGFETYIIDAVVAAGSEPRPLHDELFASNPRWSWDGSRIAFTGFDSDGSAEGIFVANADGSDVQKISDVVGLFDWSPNGTQLAVVVQQIAADGTSTGSASLVLVEVDGGSQRVLLDTFAMSPSPPTWRPATATPVAELHPAPAVTATASVADTGTLPDDYLLRTRADAEAFAMRALFEPENVTLVDVRLVTLRDQIIELAKNGGGGSPSRDTHDEPLWRVEFDGSPAMIPGACWPSCPESGRMITWYRARDGENAAYKGRAEGDYPDAPPQPVPPTSFDDLPVDPREPLLPDAEGVHAIFTTTTLFAADGGPFTTEIYLDRVNDRSLVWTSRADSTLHWLEQRDGVTRVRYVAESFNGATNEPYYTRIEDVALAADSWRVQPVTSQLDWYRAALASGHGRVVGQTEYEGQPAIEVAVGYGDFAHTAYLNPTNLLPIAVLLANDQPPASGIFELIEWHVVNTFTAAELDDTVFRGMPPLDERVTQRILAHDLDPTNIAAFMEYSIWGIRDEIATARREAQEGESTTQEDRVTLVYGSSDDRVSVTIYGRMRDDARGGFLSDGGYVNEIEIDGAPAWLRQRRGSSEHDLAFDRDGTLIVVSAPNRETAIDTAEALVPVN